MILSFPFTILKTAAGLSHSKSILNKHPQSFHNELTRNSLSSLPAFFTHFTFRNFLININTTLKKMRLNLCFQHNVLSFLFSLDDSPTTKGNFTSTHVVTYNPTAIPRTPSAKEIQEAVMLKMTNFEMKKVIFSRYAFIWRRRRKSPTRFIIPYITKHRNNFQCTCSLS